MENEEIVKAVRRGENVQENMQLLYTQNRRFMYGIARKYSGVADIDDLMQEAYFALDNAVNTFESERGLKFTTHLFYKLKAVFSDYVRECLTVSLSARDVELIARYKRIDGDTLPDGAVCSELGINKNQLRTLREMCRLTTCASLDEYDAETDTCLLDMIPSEDSVEEKGIDTVAKEQAARELWETVESLDGKQGEIIKAHFLENKTREQIAEKFGLTFKQARDEEYKAMYRLRKMRKLRELAQVYDCLNYRNTGLSAFNARQMSSVEYVTMLKLSLEEEKADV